MAVDPNFPQQHKIFDGDLATAWFLFQQPLGATFLPKQLVFSFLLHHQVEIMNLYNPSKKRKSFFMQQNFVLFQSCIVLFSISIIFSHVPLVVVGFYSGYPLTLYLALPPFKRTGVWSTTISCGSNIRQETRGAFFLPSELEKHLLQ